MHSTAIPIRFFGRVYAHPKGSNIDDRIKVSIHTVSAMITPKRFAHPLSQVLANMASLRGISRINPHYPNPGKGRLVCYKTAKLGKRPFAKAAAELFAPVARSLADTGKVLYGNTLILLLGNVDDVFGNPVIDVGRSSSFPFTKPFQNLFGPLRAFVLERTSYFLTFFPISVYFFRAKYFAITCGAYIYYAKVATHKFLHLSYLLIREVHGLKKKKFTLSTQQISFPLNEWNKFWVMAFKGYFQSPPNRPDGNPCLGIGQYPGIVRDASKKSENPLFIFFTRFIGISHLAQAPDNHLGRREKLSSDRYITGMVKVVYAKYLFIKSQIGYIGASGISIPDRYKEMIALFLGRRSFIWRVNFTIIANIVHELIERKQEVVLLPAARPLSFRTSIL